MLYICILVCFVFFAGVAMTVNEGLWNNTVNLMIVMFSSMIAALVGPPAGVKLLEAIGKGPEAMWYCTFAATWLAFAATITIARVFAGKLSAVRMKFVPPLEAAGGPIMGLVLAVMFTSFLSFTIYTMPVRAGNWELPSEGWQNTVIKSGSGPFYTALNSTVGEAVAARLTAQ